MTQTTIVQTRGRRIWDSRARPTVEVEISLACGVTGRGIAPAGASRGRHEALELRDGGDRLGGLNVMRAVENVNGEIAKALHGADAADQTRIDCILIELDGTPNKARLGANAIVAASLACLNAAAAAARQPLWAHLARDAAVRLPVPEIQIFGGGAHAARRTDIQDFLIMAPGATSFGEAVERTAEVYRHAGRLLEEAGLLAGTADEGGWWPNFRSNEHALDMLVASIEAAGYVPGEEIAISLDVAASELYRDGRYVLGLDSRAVDRDDMIEMLLDWVQRYPILSIEDPLAEDDTEGLRRFTAAAGANVQIVGDDAVVTNASRIRSAIADRWCNAALIKVNQVGTVTEAYEALRAAKAAGWGTILSARSGETEDVTLAHLAVGWDAGQVKVGSIARSERVAKWNELIRIEEALGARASYAGLSALPRNRGPMR